MKQSLLGAILLMIGLAACAPEAQTVSYQLDDQSFELMGPLFAGPNSAQATFTPDASAIVGEGKSLADQLAAAQLSQATFRMPAGQTFAGIDEIVLQMVSDQAEMVQVAVLNPVPQDANEVTLVVSEEAEVTDIMKAAPAFLVADFGLSADTDSNMTVIGDFEFSLQLRP